MRRHLLEAHGISVGNSPPQHLLDVHAYHHQKGELAGVGHSAEEGVREVIRRNPGMTWEDHFHAVDRMSPYQEEEHDFSTPVTDAESHVRDLHHGGGGEGESPSEMAARMMRERGLYNDKRGG